MAPHPPRSALFAALQRQLFARWQLKALRRFDTWQNTHGEKDVWHCRRGSREVIIRIGEARPKAFFPGGLEGKHLVVPELLASRASHIPYEIEVFIPGQLVSHAERARAPAGQLSHARLRKLVAVFWEFQVVARRLPLEQKFDISQVLEHCRLARPLLRQPAAVERVIRQHQQFWSRGYPAKWKFAPDNLILTPGGKIGLIDNVGVGLRYFGYDLGWLIWPRWLHMDIAHCQRIGQHLSYLEHMLAMVVRWRPRTGFQAVNIRCAFWLTMMERVVGATYDLAVHTPHLARCGLGVNHPRRRAVHQRFLNELLDHLITRITHAAYG